MAKAAEMLKDPQYMKAAKAKLAELEAKAKARGMLDAQGNPVLDAEGRKVALDEDGRGRGPEAAAEAA